MARREPRLPVAPPPPRLPSPSEVPAFVLLEREVEEECKPLMLETLQQKVDDFAQSMVGKEKPVCSCRKPMTYKDARPVSWFCQWGRIVARAVRWECKACKKYRRPLIEALGVEPGRLCGSLARRLAILGVVVPYQLAAHLADILLGVKVNAMAVWRVVQRLGEGAKQYNDAVSSYYADSRSEAPEPVNPPETVVAGVDGCSLGMQVRSQRRHRKEKEEKLPPLPEVEEGHFREVKTGVLQLPSERVEPSPGRRSVLRRVLITCLGNADDLFNLLWAQIQQLGWLGKETVVIIIGDGAQWIWNRASLFENRCEILDFWHAIERAWAVARLLYGEGSKTAERWVHRISIDLRDGKVKKVIMRLKKIRPKTPEAKEKLDSLIVYYTENAQRMRYDRYLRLGYGIGSGAVESAHKQLVHARLRQAGMRWSEAGAQRLLALRVLLLNGDWNKVDHLRMVA